MKTEAVHVRYREHVLFKSCDSKTIKPLVRESVGRFRWVASIDRSREFADSKNRRREG
jgi:hypothetical protein